MKNRRLERRKNRACCLPFPATDRFGPVRFCSVMFCSVRSDPVRFCKTETKQPRVFVAGLDNRAEPSEYSTRGPNLTDPRKFGCSTSVGPTMEHTVEPLMADDGMFHACTSHGENVLHGMDHGTVHGSMVCMYHGTFHGIYVTRGLGHGAPWSTPRFILSRPTMVARTFCP